MACSGGGAGGVAGGGSRSPSPTAAAVTTVAVGPPFPPSCSNTLGIPDHPHGRVRMYLDADVPGPDGELPYMKLYRSASDDEEDEDYEEPAEHHEEENTDEDDENVDPNDLGEELVEAEEDFGRIPRLLASSVDPISQETTTVNSSQDASPPNNISTTTAVPEPTSPSLPDRTGNKRRSSPDESDDSPEPKYRSRSETD